MNVTAEETASQPDVWRTAIARAAGLGDALGAAGERVLVIGCGTSAFVAQSYASLREGAGLGETDAAYASEAPTGRHYDRIVAITRSGTTTEVLEALRDVPAGTRRVALTAVTGEPVDDLVDERVLLDFADEQSIVQTRFPTSVLAMTRTAFGLDTTRLVDDGARALSAPLPVDPADFDHYVFLGTGWTVGLAHEAALKVREMAQGWSESYPAMDFRHGPVAAAGTRTLVLAFGRVDADVLATAAGAGAAVYTDDLDPLAQLLLLHRLALALAAHRGLDPDQPRLLTRSVVLAPAGPTHH
jgi:fructoselysine-6-P-deglycase FrlB-like protein